VQFLQIDAFPVSSTSDHALNILYC